MHWPWSREPLRSTAHEEVRINEELVLISRRLKVCEDTVRADP